MESDGDNIMLVQNLLSEYVKQNPTSTNTQLFSFLALLNAYVPDSYLLMSECQQILGPPDPIHGGPPFEERMEPFTLFVGISSTNPEHICIIDPISAQCAVKRLAALGISRSATVKNFMFSLCGDQPQPHILQFIKDLLTKREFGEKGKEKFSRLIEDIGEEENFYNAVSILTAASNKFKQNHIYPQTLSRLIYIRRGIIDYTKAEEWAKKAIARAPNNSYVADTLGQVYKNRLIREARQLEDILHMAEEAFKAFKDVEMKADGEEGLEMRDMAGTISISDSFNNRGLFGFIQVAKISFDKLKAVRSNPSQEHGRFIQNLVMEVEAKFDFFERYLTYSKLDMTSTEPHYFWKNVVLCYEMYTAKTAAESISFPGLLDRLNHGLFTSKGRFAGFEEAEQSVSDLEAIQDDLKTNYEANRDNVQAAESYILSNIILSNKMHNSPELTSENELKAIIHRFLDTDVGCRSPEFYLVALLLFWPQVVQDEVQDEDDEEVEQQATEDEGSEDETLEVEDSDEEQETSGEPEQLSLDLMFEPDLQQFVTFMEKAFERSDAKYLRGRYLLPLFFLGKRSVLSRWIHKSRLDAIVEKEVDAELAREQDERTGEKLSRINEKWINGDVWRIPEIEDLLLPVWVELDWEHEEDEVIVCAGGKKIKVTTEVVSYSALSQMRFYLGFTIKGPFVSTVERPH
ncbi:sterile alpha motif domain-containing protein 9-like [Anoplopoma fimbria]|uniref:sterile alpha motif domain-containing protein 9-like n=1 Tax=Anoplopoma fimbria TaxID=229290 RepID=UPI0023EDC7BF|nr:sterile alpha motif domain-containing protein 9-like [Anoplopoma fimbria]